MENTLKKNYIGLKIILEEICKAYKEEKISIEKKRENILKSIDFDNHCYRMFINVIQG